MFLELQFSLYLPNIFINDIIFAAVKRMELLLSLFECVIWTFKLNDLLINLTFIEGKN